MAYVIPRTPHVRNAEMNAPHHSRIHAMYDRSISTPVDSGTDHASEMDDELDELPGTPRSASIRPISTSPRCEAFLMTGEKMLRLNSKVSMNFAKLKESELTTHTQVIVETGPDAGKDNAFPFGDFPEPPASKRRGRASRAPEGTSNGNSTQEGASNHEIIGMPSSVSENVLSESVNPPHAKELQDTGVQTADFKPYTSQATMTNGSSTMPTPDENMSKASCVTVNAMMQEGSHLVTTTGIQTMASTGVGLLDRNWPDGHLSSSAPKPLYPGSPTAFSSRSEPVSPAKKASQSQKDMRTDEMYRTIVTVPGIDTGTQADEIVFGEASISGTPSKNRLQQLRRELGRGISQKNADPQAAARLAVRLYMLDGFKRSDVAHHLSRDNEFSALVAQGYLNQFNFAGLRIDAALRLFLSHFHLIGETQERERVVQYFSRRYQECNPGILGTLDDVHMLGAALLLLNSDLHHPGLSQHMTCRQFIDNAMQSQIACGRDLLKTLYNAIKDHPIESLNDRRESDADSSATTVSKPKFQDGRMIDIPDPDSEVEYKKGYVMRKCVVDPDGKQTPRGRRNWKMFYATLKGLILYLHKDENGFKKGQYQTFQNAIRVHHALAVTATTYTKKQHVFRLTTASLGEYLFQTSDPTDCQSWIDNINFVAACFSSPPLPAPVSSKSNQFHKPVLPTMRSKLTVGEQLKEHEKRVIHLNRQLHVHMQQAPGINSKPRQKQEFSDISFYFKGEIFRYQTYASLLRSKMSDYASEPNSASGMGSIRGSYRALDDRVPLGLIHHGVVGGGMVNGDSGGGHQQPMVNGVNHIQIDPLDEISSSEYSTSTLTSHSQQTGQSDRHSYKAAIHNHASASAHTQHNENYESSF